MRYSYYGQRDTRDFTDGDNRFIGVDSTRDRSLLQQGMMAVAQNSRLRSGNCGQRLGTRRPSDFNPAFSNRFAGSGVFRDPNSNEILLIAPINDTKTYALQYGKDPFVINYSAAAISAGFTNQLGTEFVQSFDKVSLLSRPTQAQPSQLVWDGTGDANGDGAADSDWELITLSSDGLTLVPTRWNGEPVQDRVVYYSANFLGVNGRDDWLVSDINDYTSYDDIFQTGRTNAGESDFITRIFAYYHGAFVVFKSKSIHMVTLNPVFPLTFTQQILSVRLGSYGNKMPLEVGGDIIFLSEPGGFFRLSEVIQEQITTLPVAISEPIQPTINGLNWLATKFWGCSASIDNYALFGVGIGLNTARCNALLVYNTQTRQWESVPDTWADPTFGFNALHVTTYDGVQRVFALDYDNSVVYLLYEGLGDDLKSGFWATPFRMETRGYVGDDAFSMKVFRRITAGISTFNPSVNITAISDGAFEEKNLTPTPITKDNTKFYTHGKAAFNPLTDDPNVPMREDYSITGADLAAVEDFEELPDGPISRLPPTDFGVTGTKQQSVERRLYRGSGRWVSLRIENSEGECDVLGVNVEGSQTMNSIKAVA